MKDLVLQEVGKAKDELAAECGHDINTLFRKLEVQQKTSGKKYVYPKVRKTKKN
jgi:hypothetical protein